MNDLQVIDGEISEALRELQKQAQTVISAATLPEKKKQEATVRPTIRDIKKQLTAFRAEIRRTTEPTQKHVFEKKYKEYDEKVKETEKELRNQIYPSKAAAPKKSYSEKHVEDLMGEGGADGQGFENATQVLGAGVRINNDALESLRRSERLAAITEDTGRETLTTLQKQTEQMYKIDEELENLQGELDRASRDVKWFARQMAGDKCFLAVFAVVVFALICLVGYATYQKKNE